MVQHSSSPFGYRSPSDRSEEGRVGNMKSAKPQVNYSPHGESQRALSPLQSTPSSAAPSQAYETYIDNGLICLKHKIRNIEKKKLKLEDYKDRLKNGEQLNPDQLEAVGKYEEVLHHLGFARELQKTFSALSQDLLKAQKKAQRREHMLKLEAEKKKLRTILQIHVEDQMEQSSLYFWDLLEGSEEAVVGTTYKHVKDLLSKLLNSGYFESVPVPQNTKGKEEEMLTQSEKREQLSKTESIKESESVVEFAQPEIQPQEFLNRRYMTEVNYSRKQDEERSWEANYARKPNPPKCWDVLPEPDGQKKQQESLQSRESPVKPQEVSKPVVSVEQRKPGSTLQEEQKQRLSIPPVSQWKPDTPKSKVGGTEEEQNAQETPKTWVVQQQKEQESKKPPVSWMEPVQSEQNTSRSWATTVCREQASAQPGASKSWENSAKSQKHSLVPQSQISPKSWGATSAGLLPHDQLLPRKLNSEHKVESVLDFDKPSSAIPSSQPPSASPVSTVSTEQSVSSQSDFLQEPLQVFNVNAPLPPRKEQEVKESPYSPRCNQNFTSSSTQTPPQSQPPAIHVEQTVLPQETAAGYHPDGTVQVSNGSLAFYPAHTSMFPRPAQPFVSSRGSVRGCPRGGRLLTNPFRSPGGYKGFDSYRGPPSVSNGNYSQLQLQAREYPGTPYSQKENFQPCYKRAGLSGGPQASSRGWSDSSQVSSPERDSETFNSGDSGQGDSRSMTPVDVPVTSPAAAILPVHVYPLPQQMRVAFSAARTSNLAPGTLDQPIVFDLLLNNLGETFDLQLGRFNCPVNGTYVFIFHMLKLAMNVPLYVNLMKNEEVLVSAYANDGAPDHETASNHAILQLLQGDQIWLRLHRGAIYGSSWKYSTFSGYLLYQD